MEIGERFNPRGIFRGIYIPDGLARLDTVSMGAKVCYARLCWFAGDEGEAKVNQTEIASSLGVSERQVRTYVDELIDAGFIEAEQRGQRMTNVYSFVWNSQLNDSIRGGKKGVVVSDRKNTSGPNLSDRKDTSASDRKDVAGPSLLNESVLENSITPLPPSPEKTEHKLPDAKELKWRMRDAGLGPPSKKDLDALVDSLSDIAADRGAGVVAQLVDQFPAHCRRMAKEDLPPRDKAVRFFLGYLRKWEPDSPPEPSDCDHPPVDTTREPIVTPRGSQPPRNHIVADAPDPVEEFLAAWNAGPCQELRLKAVTEAHRRGVAACLRQPQFSNNQTEIIQKCHAMRPKPGKDWLNLSWILKNEQWARILNGELDWTPSQNGGGKKARHDVTSGPAALAAYQAKIRLQIQEEEELERAQAQ